MRIEQQPSAGGDLLRKQTVVRAVCQHNIRCDSERHKTTPHFKSGNEQFAFVKAAPLETEIRQTFGAVVTHANEIAASSL